MENKKGSEMTIGTIIFIVLGVAVLVLLIFGFTTGWSNLWGKITGFTGGGANIDVTKQACQLVCVQQDVYGFNDMKRTVKTEDGYSNSTVTCKIMLSTINVTKGKDSKFISVGVTKESCPQL